MSSVSKEGKTMLLNTIKIVEHQNKVSEEKKMWKLREQKKRDEKSKRRSREERKKSDHRSKHKSKHKSDSHRKKKKRHRSESREDKKRNYWMKKLYEAKQKDDDKWQHNGFKELYPEEFVSSSDEEGKKSK